jgi:hypothetical protein
MLGTILGGAAEGAASADRANVDTQNKQIMAENLMKEQAQVNDMYTKATEQRHIEQGRSAREYTSGIITPIVAKQLAAQGLVPPGTTPGDGQKAATQSEYTQALGNAYAEAGIVPGNEVFAGATHVMGQQVKGEAIEEVANIAGGSRENVAKTNKEGKLGAADIRANTPPKNANSADTRAKTMNSLHAAATDYALPPAIRQAAADNYAKMLADPGLIQPLPQSGGTGLLASPAVQAPTTTPLDSLFPNK